MAYLPTSIIPQHTASITQRSNTSFTVYAKLVAWFDGYVDSMNANNEDEGKGISLSHMSCKKFPLFDVVVYEYRHARII